MRIPFRQDIAVATIGVVFSFCAVAQAEAPVGFAAAAHAAKVTPPKLPAVCPNADLEPAAANLAAIDRATICLINKERVARGLVALAENVRLDRAAARHSRDMVAGNFFADDGPRGQRPAQRTVAAGYGRGASRYRVGQNVAIGSTGADTPAQIVAAWMNQPQHRAVLLRAFYRETGLGTVAAVPARYANGRTGTTYTQVFGVVG
jgi:uncharacterized protein YkwD